MSGHKLRSRMQASMCWKTQCALNGSEMPMSGSSSELSYPAIQPCIPYCSGIFGRSSGKCTGKRRCLAIKSSSRRKEALIVSSKFQTPSSKSAPERSFPIGTWNLELGTSVRSEPHVGCYSPYFNFTSSVSDSSPGFSNTEIGHCSFAASAVRFNVSASRPSPLTSVSR